MNRAHAKKKHEKEETNIIADYIIIFVSNFLLIVDLRLIFIYINEFFSLSFFIFSLYILVDKNIIYKYLLLS